MSIHDDMTSQTAAIAAEYEAAFSDLNTAYQRFMALKESIEKNNAERAAQVERSAPVVAALQSILVR